MGEFKGQKPRSRALSRIVVVVSHRKWNISPGVGASSRVVIFYFFCSKAANKIDKVGRIPLIIKRLVRLDCNLNK